MPLSEQPPRQSRYHPTSIANHHCRPDAIDTLLSVPFALLDELLHTRIAAPQRQKGAIVLQRFRDVWDVKLIAHTEAVVRFTKVRPRGNDRFKRRHGGVVLLEPDVNDPQAIARFPLV